MWSRSGSTTTVRWWSKHSAVGAPMKRITQSMVKDNRHHVVLALLAVSLEVTDAILDGDIEARGLTRFGCRYVRGD